MTGVRRLGATMLIVPMMVVSALLAGAAPANAADAEILSPSDGEVVNTSGPVAVSAKTDWYQVRMSLYVEGPSTSRQKIATGGANQTIGGSFDPGDAPNGTFTVSLIGDVTHKTYATSTFVLSRPPEAPTGVRAKLGNASTIVVSWARGSEPDLQTYEITSVKAGTSGSVSVDSACSGSACQADLKVPAEMAGQKVDVSVRAFRSDGIGGTIGSQGSPAVLVTMPTPKASPTPSPSPTRKPDGSAGTSPNAKTPKTRHPTAVPKPEPELPVDTQPQGGTGSPEDSELALPEKGGGGAPAGPVVAPKESDAPKTTAQSSFLPLGGLSYGVYVAIAVVLLLVGANLGAWLRRKGMKGNTSGDGRPGDADAVSGALPDDGIAVAEAVSDDVTAVSGAVPDEVTAVSGSATETAPSVVSAADSRRQAALAHQVAASPADHADERTPRPAGRPGRMPLVPTPAVPAGAAFNGQMPERPLRQPEPDVWTGDDDLYSGRHPDR